MSTSDEGREPLLAWYEDPWGNRVRMVKVGAARMDVSAGPEWARSMARNYEEIAEFLERNPEP